VPETALTDDELRGCVLAELSWDPRVDSAGIAVAVLDGAVTLRGVAGSVRAQREAENAARRVYGVTAVRCQLAVLALDNEDRDDADLRGDVLQALMLDVLLPMTIEARAREGVVTLTGTARWRFQRDEAEFLTAGVPGVTAIRNDIRLIPAPAEPDTGGAIRAAFARNARLRVSDLSVDLPAAGKVVLAGVVDSWAERDEAVATAWRAPGVTQVDDQIQIEY
jgi:osmotically-inducible protein OsmY